MNDPRRIARRLHQDASGPAIWILVVLPWIAASAQGQTPAARTQRQRNPPSAQPVRVEVIQPLHKSAFNDQQPAHQRREGGQTMREGDVFVFSGASDGDRQVDPQIAVGGGYVLHGTNLGWVIYDKAGKFVEGVTPAAFQGGIDPKLFYSPHQGVFGFDLWNPWDADQQKPVNISISESSDPRAGWNTYPVPAPQGRDGGGIGFSRTWLGYSFPGGPEQTFLMKLSELTAGQPAQVFHFGGNLGHPVMTQDPLDELYFLSVTDRQFIVRRIVAAADGTPRMEEVSARNHGLEFIGFPPPSPQQNSPQKTASGDRNPKNIVVQNGCLWFSQAVNCHDRSAVQWIQMRFDGEIVQHGLIASATSSYIQTSLAVNSQEDLLVGFQETSEAMFISPRFAWRRGSDPPGRLRETVRLGEGQAPTQGTSWGDYSGSTLDGDNQRDLWTVQSQAGSDGKNDCVIARLKVDW